MDESMSSKPTRDPIKNEADNGEKNVRGTLAMARTGVVDSATSQFFINLIDNAVKYTDVGEINININNDETNLIFKISDSDRHSYKSR